MLDVVRVALRQSWSSLFTSGDFWLGVIVGALIAWLAIVLLHWRWERQGWRLTHPE